MAQKLINHQSVSESFCSFPTTQSANRFLVCVFALFVGSFSALNFVLIHLFDGIHSCLASPSGLNLTCFLIA